MADEGNLRVAYASGTYNPTGVAVANADSVAPVAGAIYTRHGNTVRVSGSVVVDPTVLATLTQVRISLPIASNLGVAADAAGLAVNHVDRNVGTIIGDATNNDVELRFVSILATAETFFFDFAYRII